MTSLRNDLTDLQARLDTLAAKNKDLTHKLTDREKELTKTSAELSRWNLWWAWVSAQASTSLLKLSGRSGRKPPRSLGDRGLGGGQRLL